MKHQQLLSYVRRAVQDYSMISAGDRIIVGISGGKDSLTLLLALHGLRRFFPKPFDVRAITIDLGFPDTSWDAIIDLCSELDLQYDIIKTDIADIVFEQRKEKNPCALCSTLRKGVLNEAAKEAGMTKIAYGHHRDDAVETMLLSLIYEGRIHTFSPVTHLNRMDITVIRPMIYVDEADVLGYVRKYDLPVMKSPCPIDGHTKREYVKEVLCGLDDELPGIYTRVFTAIQRSKIEGWSV
jgi:tRNA(Ile)-lysidine synthase TilS/MesJ